MDIFLTGTGWVNPTSMGHKNNVKVFPFPNGLPSISREDILEQPYKPFGRMDDYSKLGLAAGVFAVRDAYGQNPPPKNTGIIASTSNGCIETDIKYQSTLNHDNNTLPSPAIFAYTLPSCFLGEISILYGTTGESLIINEPNSTGLKGLGMALDLLLSEQSDAVLCGINNAGIQYLSESTESIKPGALFCLLETKKRNHARIYGNLRRDASNHAFFYNETKIASLYDLTEAV